MRRAMYWGAGLLAATLLALALAVILFDWSRLAPWVSARLSDRAGREVTVARLDVDWSWHPRIVIDGLHVANADWSKGKPLAEVERLDVTLSIPALFRGRLELPHIAVTRPRLRLEQDRQGRANWDFTAGTAAPDDRGEMPVIGTLSITDGALDYRDPRKGIDFKSRLDSIAAEGGSGREQVQLAGDGTVEGKPFTLSLTGGSLLALRTGEDPYPLRLEAKAGGTRFTLDGTMRDPVKLDGADLALTLKGPDLAEIFPIFGIPTPTTAAYDLAGRLRRGDGLWRVDDLKGKVGESDLAGCPSIRVRTCR